MKKLSQLIEGLLYRQVLTENTKLTVVTAELESLRNSRKASDGKHNSVQEIRFCANNDCKICIVLFSVLRSTEQLEERLKAAQADKEHAKGQEATGQRILTWTRDEKNKIPTPSRQRS